MGGGMSFMPQMINSGSDFNPKPPWHNFDLSETGSLPTAGNMLARWVVADGDSAKIPDSTANLNHLYLTGAAGLTRMVI